MGVYDEFQIPGSSDHVQLKVGPCQMDLYMIGAIVPLEDGVYLSDNGAIVILNKKYAAYFTHVIDKWGGLLDTGSIIWNHNSLVQALIELKVKEIFMPSNDDSEKSSQRQAELDQMTAELSDTLPHMWKRLFDVCQSVGFTEEQAFKLVQTYIVSIGGGKISP